MFTVNNKAHISVSFRLADIENGGVNVPAESDNSNWPYPQGKDVGFRKSNTPDVQVVQLPHIDIGRILEGAQKNAVNMRDQMALGVIGANRVIRDTRKSLPKF